MNIGGRIKENREKLGISQRELARRIDMSGQMISKIESGLSTPSIDTINKIAALLNVKAASLLEDYNEESFSYKLICAIEEAYKDKSNGSVTRDIFQDLSKDLDIDYEEFDSFQIKRTNRTKDDNGSYVYTEIFNDSLDRTKNLPIGVIKKLLTYYSELDNYKFQKLCSDIFYDNIPATAEIKNIINTFIKEIEPSNNLVSETQECEHKNYNISEYYKYLEIRIMELSADSNINIDKATSDEIIKNVDSLIEFELHKIKTNLKNSK